MDLSKQLKKRKPFSKESGSPIDDTFIKSLRYDKFLYDNTYFQTWSGVEKHFHKDPKTVELGQILMLPNGYDVTKGVKGRTKGIPLPVFTKEEPNGTFQLMYDTNQIQHKRVKEDKEEKEKEKEREPILLEPCPTNVFVLEWGKESLFVDRKITGLLHFSATPHHQNKLSSISEFCKYNATPLHALLQATLCVLKEYKHTNREIQFVVNSKSFVKMMEEDYPVWANTPRMLRDSGIIYLDAFSLQLMQYRELCYTTRKVRFVYKEKEIINDWKKQQLKKCPYPNVPNAMQELPKTDAYQWMQLKNKYGKFQWLQKSMNALSIHRLERITLPSTSITLFRHPGDDDDRAIYANSSSSSFSSINNYEEVFDDSYLKYASLLKKSPLLLSTLDFVQPFLLDSKETYCKIVIDIQSSYIQMNVGANDINILETEKIPREENTGTTIPLCELLIRVLNRLPRSFTEVEFHMQEEINRCFWCFLEGARRMIKIPDHKTFISMTTKLKTIPADFGVKLNEFKLYNYICMTLEIATYGRKIKFT